MSAADHDLWVFGYGSLMWRPGFAFVEARRARVIGYRRCFCIHSVHHRGTPQRPGMVLGLDRGGACSGIVYRVRAENAAETIAYLRSREQVNGVYREAHLPAEITEGENREVTALAYIVERAHPSYAGQLPLVRQARLIRGAQGISGVNLDYLISTLHHLAELGIREPELERILALIGPHTARCPVTARGSAAAVGILRAAARQPITLRHLRPEQRRRFLYRLRVGSANGGRPAAGRSERQAQTARAGSSASAPN
jgi:glutathione-specific gamma-glutamylcyclotransferase